jgi:hypothetical protein
LIEPPAALQDNIVFALAFLVLVLFAASLRSYLRRAAAAEGLGANGLAGAVLIATGSLIGSGVEYGLAKEIHHLGPESVKTLNFITEELPFLPGCYQIATGMRMSRRV